MSEYNPELPADGELDAGGYYVPPKLSDTLRSAYKRVQRVLNSVPATEPDLGPDFGGLDPTDYPEETGEFL